MRRPLPAILAALALTLAACTGGGSPGTATSPTPEPATGGGAASSGFPVTVDTSAGELTIEQRPERIVSLSPSETETLFAIGAADQVIAVDAQSTYPEEAPTTALSGFEPNVEAIAGYEPDLLVIATDTDGLSTAMNRLGVPVFLSEAPANVEGAYDRIAALGIATGHPDEAAAVVATMRQDIATAMSKAPDAPIRVYHELDSNHHSASSLSFIGSIYEEMGAQNIADPADTDRTGYPQLTEEAIIAADPELIVITDQSGYTGQDVAERPGWAQITAVRNDAIVTVDADIASRWGPRLPQFVTTVAEAMGETATAIATAASTPASIGS